jgi:Fe-S cluster assembly protein SufD
MVEFQPVPTLTVDAVRALEGPAWLRDRRLAAAEQLAATALPTTEEEVWRYSRIGELDLDRFAPAADEVRVDGAAGLLGESLDGLSDSAAELAATASDAFDHANASLAAPIVLRVPAGKVIDEPIVVEHVVSGGGIVTAPHLVIDAGDDAELTVVERFTSLDGAISLTVPRLDLRAGQAARVRYLAINELGAQTWMIGRQRAIGERDSSVTLASVSLGGDYARVRTDARAAGQGASTRQIALFFADGSQMHDFRTLQDHTAPKTTSDLLFKGAVKDTARSVYTGLIRIGREARGTVAFQTNRNLTLSKGAWAESVPNLEIETNDVRCSHASTVGPIDADQRFYLESRGVRPAAAERLIVLGFFDEVIEQLPVRALAPGLRAKVQAKLDRDAAGRQA